MSELFLSTGSRKQIYEGVQVGEAHYSYNVVFKRFLQAINISIDKNPLMLRHPEMYKTESAKLTINCDSSSIHISFKSPEDLRLLDGAYNIAHIAWEFNVLPKYPGPRVGPLARPRFALGMMNEVWVGCEFTKNVLILEGLSNVHVIPSPIPLPSSLAKENLLEVIGDSNAIQLNFSSSNGTLKHASTTLRPFREMYSQYYRFAKPKVYLTIANIWDYRKNIPNLVKIFELFHAQRPDTMLVVKLVLDNLSTRINNVNEIFALHFGEWIESGKCNGIFFISDQMSDEGMSALFRASDFYLNLSRAEGQALPVLEAMANGVVPISVDHTAMADYINEENAFVVKSALVQVSPSMPYPSEGLTWYEFDSTDALRTLENAYLANADLIQSKSERCLELIESNYSNHSVGLKILARVTSIQSCISV